MKHDINEQETIINLYGKDKFYSVYTCQPKMLRKLIKQGYEPTKCEYDNGELTSAEFTVPFGRISILCAK